MSKTYKIVILVLISVFILSCEDKDKTNRDAQIIYNQLPEYERLALVPDGFMVPLKGKNVIIFSLIIDEQSKLEKIFTEEEFYDHVRSIGVQYIIISSDMIKDNSSKFPWIIEKNFKICPGDPDSDFEKYYVLLVWDNTRNSYHFFKYLYPVE